MRIGSTSGNTTIPVGCTAYQNFMALGTIGVDVLRGLACGAVDNYIFGASGAGQIGVNVGADAVDTVVDNFYSDLDAPASQVTDGSSSTVRLLRSGKTFNVYGAVYARGAPTPDIQAAGAGVHIGRTGGASDFPGIELADGTANVALDNASGHLRVSRPGVGALLRVNSSGALELGSLFDAGLSRVAARQLLADLLKWKAANKQTTVGAAGGASALPATPTRYLKVVGSGGEILVIPAYVAT